MIEQRYIWGSLAVVVLMIFFAGQIDSQAAFTADEVQSLFGTQSSFGDLVQQREGSGLKLLEEGCFSGTADWGCLGYDAVGLVETKYNPSTDKCSKKITEQYSCPVGKYCVSGTVNALNKNHDALSTWQCTGTTKVAQEIPKTPVEFQVPFNPTNLKVDLTQAQPLPDNKYINPDGSLTAEGQALYGTGVTSDSFTTKFDGLEVVQQGGRMTAFNKGDMTNASESTLMNGVCSVQAFIESESCPDGSACVPFRKLIADDTLTVSKVDSIIVWFVDHISDLVTAGSVVACPFTAGTTCAGLVVGGIGAQLVPTDGIIQKLANWNILSSYFAYDLDSAGLCTAGVYPTPDFKPTVPPLGPNSPSGTDPKTFSPLGSQELLGCDVDAIAASVCPIGGTTCPTNSRCVSIGALEAAQEIPKDCGADISEHYQNQWVEQGVRLGGCALAAGTLGAKAVKGVQAIGLGGKRTTLKENVDVLKKLKWGGNKRLVKGKAATAIAATATLASWFKAYTPAILAGSTCVGGAVAANYMHNVLTDKREDYGICLSNGEADDVEARAVSNDPSRESGIKGIAKEVLDEVYTGIKNLIKNPVTSKIILYLLIGLIAYILLKFIWRKI